MPRPPTWWSSNIGGDQPVNPEQLRRGRRSSNATSFLPGLELRWEAKHLHSFGPSLEVDQSVMVVDGPGAHSAVMALKFARQLEQAPAFFAPNLSGLAKRLSKSISQGARQQWIDQLLQGEYSQSRQLLQMVKDHQGNVLAGPPMYSQHPVGGLPTSSSWSTTASWRPSGNVTTQSIACQAGLVPASPFWQCTCFSNLSVSVTARSWPCGTTGSMQA